MSYRDRNRKKDKRQKRSENTFFNELGVNNNVEKQKARELRKSSWWKKKISEGICYYCGEKFSSEELTMDHKIPLARGGFSEKINLVAACKECNNKKKHLLPHEWDEYMNNIKNGNLDK